MAVLGVLLGITMTVLGGVAWFKRDRIRHWLFIEEAERQNVISSGELEILREELAESVAVLRADIVEVRTAVSALGTSLRSVTGQQTAVLKAQRVNQGVLIEAIDKLSGEQASLSKGVTSIAAKQQKPAGIRRQWSEDVPAAEA